MPSPQLCLGRSGPRSRSAPSQDWVSGSRTTSGRTARLSAPTIALRSPRPCPPWVPSSARSSSPLSATCPATCGGRLVNDDKHGAVFGLQLGEQLAQLRLSLGQQLVEGLLHGRGQRGCVVLALAYVQTPIDIDGPVLVHVIPASRLRTVPACPRHHGAGIHVTDLASMSLISGLPMPSRPETGPSRSGQTGDLSHARTGGREPRCRPRRR